MQFQRLLEEALAHHHTTDEVLSRLKSIKGYARRTLGTIAGKPILLLTPQDKKPGPNLLIASGFHGNEQAGPFGILHFLENHIININLSFLPLVNPVGFDKNSRDGQAGHNPNRGFDGDRQVSSEGAILLQHDKLLKSLARDGFISLHEDPDKKTFHIFTYERLNKPSAFSESMRTCCVEYHDTSTGMLNTTVGALDSEEEGQLKHHQKVSDVVEEPGLVFNDLDGSYESYMFRSGVRFAACTETGGRIDFNLRVRANSEIIKRFVELSYSASR